MGRKSRSKRSIKKSNMNEEQPSVEMILLSETKPENNDAECHINDEVKNVNESTILPTKIIKEKLILTLDHLNKEVESFRRKSFDLMKKRDFLLNCIDLLKSDDTLKNASKLEREKVRKCRQIIDTVNVRVSTERDNSQERSLFQVNSEINTIIAGYNPTDSYQRCQVFLNTCCGVKSETGIEIDDNLIDKKFEALLLGCTLDDQKEIKDRLKALSEYIKMQKLKAF